MQLLITDANILIDFIEGDLINEIFALNHTLQTPDVLFYEELADRHSDLLDLGLKLAALDATAMQNAYQLHSHYHAVSTHDCMALALAKQAGCSLLTGDGLLRKTANLEQVDVKGSLWLMEQLLIESIISRQQCQHAFNNMKQAYRRLPWVEVDKLLARWD